VPRPRTTSRCYAADSYAVLTFAVPHGCGGSATTKVAIQLPEEIISVTPTVNPNWTVETMLTGPDPEVTGSQDDDAGDGAVQVVYTATTPLPDGLRDTFELSMRLPDLPGQTLAFPIVQTCEDGEIAWTQVADDGADAHDLATPAPVLRLTDREPTDEAGGDTIAVAASTDARPSTALGTAGLTAGLVGAVLGALALAQTRQQA
jgi:periplasmic copper chaperone A